PDERADNGRHIFKYALLPHDNAFSVESVVRPAYEFNITPIAVPAPHDAQGFPSFVTIDSPNVILESLKIAEDSDHAILRLYEASRCATHATLRFNRRLVTADQTNMLEELPQPLPLDGKSFKLIFRPFEIKT